MKQFIFSGIFFCTTLCLSAQSTTADSSIIHPITALDSLPATFSFFSLPQNFYTNKLKGACAVEWKLEKATGVAIRLRLGSLAYCNSLEGKP